MTDAESLRSAPSRVATSTWVDKMARYGLVAKGVSYILVGFLAVAVVVSDDGKATSREGALATVADESGGPILLGALAAGFVAYALWRLAQAVFERSDDGVKDLAKRVGYLGRAAIYVGLTYSAIRLLAGRGDGTSQTGEARKTTAHVLDWPGGRWIVALAGLAVVGVGVFNGYRAFTQKFEDKWRTHEMSDAELRWGGRIGSIGLFSRFAVFSLIGAFFVKAALEHDPQEAVGLDGALREIAQADYGPWLLGVVALGLVLYGIFCFIEARYRRV